MQTNTVSNIAICTSSNGWEAGRRESNKVEMETNTLGKDKYFKYLDNYSWQFTKIQRPVQAAMTGRQDSNVVALERQIFQRFGQMHLAFYKNTAICAAAMTGRQESNVVAIPAQADKSLPPVTMEVTIYSRQEKIILA